MYCNIRLSKKIEHKKNTQLCLNTPRDFGTTHFIIGYKEKSNSPVIEPIIEKKEKKRRQSQHTAQKKQKVTRGGANLIDKNRMTQSFFSSVHDISDILLHIMAEAQRSLYIEVFSLTDQRIANLIIAKHKEKVEVCVIVDAENMKYKHSKVQCLVENNVPVWRYNPAHDPRCQKNGLCEPCMHHKCTIVDGKVVVTGSANLTNAAHKYNIENINVLREKQTVNEHGEEFGRLKLYCDSVEHKSYNFE